MPQLKPRLLRGSAETHDPSVTEAPQKSGLVRSRPRKRLSKMFILCWSLSFLTLFGALYALGFVPAAVAEAGDAISSFFRNDGGRSLSIVTSTAEATVETGAAPVIDGISTGEPRILIDDIDVNAGIVFPESADLNILNTALTEGVVYYPGSGKFGEVGNVFLFGHSTGLKVVYNKNFEVFNRLKELEAGDVIRVQSDGREYWYRVLSTTIKKADDANINLSTARKLLTISTCRIFGGREDRYVVEAEFMRSYPLRVATSAADTSS